MREYNLCCSQLNSPWIFVYIFQWICSRLFLLPFMREDYFNVLWFNLWKIIILKFINISIVLGHWKRNAIIIIAREIE